ncbi:hypothetical protein MTR_3g091075 [Medicago truncatula]|uniref:Uncharacterized protein n=1 Tax=Medicago truncatula TaxID=3880 RepID=A0A072V275_MEDTR|nr:hypothetical protein MTR_3g091075 [Medicago truncatula]
MVAAISENTLTSSRSDINNNNNNNGVLPRRKGYMKIKMEEDEDGSYHTLKGRLSKLQPQRKQGEAFPPLFHLPNHSTLVTTGINAKPHQHLHMISSSPSCERSEAVYCPEPASSNSFETDCSVQS